MQEEQKGLILANDQVTSKFEPESSLESVDTHDGSSIRWSSLAYKLGLEGLAQEVAVNSTLNMLAEDHFQLSLSPQIHKLVDEEISEVINQAIDTKLGVSLKLEFLPQDPLLAETPHLCLQRRLHEQREAAIDDIKNDKLVKKLNRAFGAELIESSVTRIDKISTAASGENNGRSFEAPERPEREEQK